MDSLLLSQITKDFLDLDPAALPGRERYRMGWGGSLLAPHAKAPKLTKEERNAALLLIALRERLNGLFTREEAPAVSLNSAPRLQPPTIPPAATFRPPWYFSRGALEADRRKTPEPIPYLLTETDETAKARPVPGSPLFLRSLCKGKGVLRKNKQGLIYLDVDNRFISMIFPFLKSYGLVKPPYFNLFGAPEGAHIPVIPAREAAFQYLSELSELGEEFSFELEGLYSMEPASWPEVMQVWFFKIQSEELEALRRRHFLPALPGGHSFQIAVAVKPRVGEANAPRPLPLMRVNEAYACSA